MTLKNKLFNNTINNPIVDYCNFICYKFMKHNPHEEIRASQDCLIFLFIIIVVCCIPISYCIVGYFYHSYIEERGKEWEKQENTIITYMSEGIHIINVYAVFPFIVFITLSIMYKYCYLIPYEEWKKDYEERRKDIEMGNIDADD